MKNSLEFLKKVPSWNKAYELQKQTLLDFYDRSGAILEGSIGLRPFDPALLTMERNLFSTLFLAVIGNLPVPEKKLPFYALAIHCLRALVTGCDNILDKEYKEVIPFNLGEGGSAMKSVFMIMTADRILSDAAMEMISSGIMESEQASRLSSAVMKALADSGIEEHEEESSSGDEYPSPARMLDNYLYRKTGRLFEAPLNLIIEMGDLPCEESLWQLRMLSQFGIGCQLLDEIRDFPEDLEAGGYNMISSLLYHGPDRISRSEALAYIRGEGKNGPDVEKAVIRARKKCFAIASEHFLSVKSPLMRAIPEFGYRELFSMAGYIKTFILKDDDIPENLI